MFDFSDDEENDKFYGVLFYEQSLFLIKSCDNFHDLDIIKDLSAGLKQEIGIIFFLFYDDL